MGDPWGSGQRKITLWRAAVAGEPAAVDAFVRAHNRCVRGGVRAALKGCSGVPAVDDFVNAVWLHLLERDGERLAKFNPDNGARLSTWLYAVAGNVVRSHLRRRREVLAACPERLPERRDPGPSPEARAIGAERVALLHLAASRLPDGERRLFQALIVQDRPAAEVAAELGITTAAIHVRKHRMVRRLEALAREITPAAGDAPGRGKVPAREGV